MPGIPPIPPRRPPPPPPEDDALFTPQAQTMKTDPLSGGGAAGDWPLKLVQVDSENVKATLGTINGFVPTNVNTNIDMSGESDDTYYFFYHVTINAAGIVTAAELDYNTTGAPADTTYESYRLAGIVVVASAEVTSVTNSFGWSQSFSTCDRDADDPATTPGQYFWQTGA
jgi:hypothetical protein